MFGQYILVNNAAVEAYMKLLENAQRPLYQIGFIALRWNDLDIDRNPANYVAFRRGFAAFEIIATAVKAASSPALFTYAQFQKLYATPPLELVEIELSNRVSAWQRDMPNTAGAITDAGAHMGETFEQLHARLIGAQIACELQRNIPQAA